MYHPSFCSITLIMKFIQTIKHFTLGRGNDEAEIYELGESK